VTFVPCLIGTCGACEISATEDREIAISPPTQDPVPAREAIIDANARTVRCLLGSQLEKFRDVIRYTLTIRTYELPTSAEQLDDHDLKMRLRHLHIPNLPLYTTVSDIQEAIRRQFLSAKNSSSSSHPPPPPTLLSFTPHPTYTYGRRQKLPSSFSPDDQTTIPGLHPRLLQPGAPALSSPLLLPDSPTPYTPEIHPSPRGGLTTYHGPGQIVLWPVVDLVSPHFSASLGVRSYACLLEKTTISVLSALFSLRTFTTADPGVWTGPESRPRKIAAMGVHLRRHVSSLGVAVNLDMPYITSDDVGRNPWSRIVPCGLDREVTDVGGEMGRDKAEAGELGGERFAGAWAEELAGRLGLEGVEGGEGDLERLLTEAEGQKKD
jgi:lipoyl(octanoyl) transferase